MNRTTRRAGYSLMELMVVIAAITILGGVLIPTLTGVSRDTRVKAGADTFRGMMADARGRAMQDGQAYRLAISTNGLRIRIAPDTFESLGEAAMDEDDDDGEGPLIREEDLPTGVTMALMMEETGSADVYGWQRVATFEPLGTCREDSVGIQFNEPGVKSLILRIRGLTGTAEQVEIDGSVSP